MSNIIATHPERGKKEFSLPVWEAISKWENQGGWTRVMEQPKEPLAQPIERAESTEAPAVKRKKAKT